MSGERRRISALVAAAILALSGCAIGPVGEATSTPTAKDFKIVGYVTPAATLNLIDFTEVTHVNYAFLLPRANGTLRPFGAPRHLRQTVALAHAAGAKVLISVGGWGWDDEFEALASADDRRTRFVGELVDFVERNELDGADIDWEYPDAGASAQGFLALVRDLRAALPRGTLLTAAVIARAGDGEGIETEALEVLDFVNIMAYDDGSGDHSTFELAESALRSWRARGLPAERCVLGVPFYARPGDVSYRKLLQYDRAAADGDRIRYFTTEQHYNGPETLRKKTRLAMQEGGGIMIWELSQDAVGDDSLLGVIAETVRSAP